MGLETLKGSDWSNFVA